ncbi:MAG TPA: EVE domain-containing protein [Acidobacteriota bacterium]|nr:EVE domain-containing protein [Acidobacteriota bacterium]
MAQYWLMKSEPNEYSIDDLKRDGRSPWYGVRNYQARNIMRDDMKAGDEVLYYHSNAKPPGIVGRARVVKEGYPDHTAQDPDDKHYDPKASQDDPRWFMVDIEFVEKFPRLLALPDLRQVEALQQMVLLNRSRLSVQPVKEEEFDLILRLAKEGFGDS